MSSSEQTTTCRLADANSGMLSLSPDGSVNWPRTLRLAEFAHREQVGLLAYSPLGFGVLSGKYLHDAKPPGTRLVLFDRFTRYTNPQALAATEAYIELAQDSGLDPAQMALAFVTSRPFLTSNIIGATKMPQLKTNIESIDLSLGKDVIKQIEAIQERIPNPAP